MAPFQMPLQEQKVPLCEQNADNRDLLAGVRSNSSRQIMISRISSMSKIRYSEFNQGDMCGF